jgi:hypothetical protein
MLLFHLPILLIPILILKLQVKFLLLNSFFSSCMCFSLLVYLCLNNNMYWCIQITYLSMFCTSCFSFWITTFTCFKEFWTCMFFSTTYWLTRFSPDISNNMANIFLLYFATYWNIPNACLCGSSLPTISTSLGVWKLNVTPCELIFENISNEHYMNLFTMEVLVAKPNLSLAFRCTICGSSRCTY